MFKVNQLVPLFVLISSRFALPDTVSICPNKCSGQGICTSSSVGTCQCFPGFIGVDCSLLVCPSGVAWVDFPHGTNKAHQRFTECSNMGVCDRSLGRCECNIGYSGPACDTMLCPMNLFMSPLCQDPFSCTSLQVCSGHGSCIPLSEATVNQDFYNGSDYRSYSYSDWDANMVHGCDCDDGWEGVACDIPSCPKGDDPLTIGVDEVQLIDCRCYGGGCSVGNLYVTFKGKQTSAIPMLSAPEVLAYRLEQLANIEVVQVTVLTGQTVCSSAGSVTQVSFKVPQGPQPALSVASDAEGTSVSVKHGGTASSLNSKYISTAGTREYVECSNRGVCDRTTGLCDCFGNFRSSNGLGSAGSRGDCGYQWQTTSTYTLWNGSKPVHVITACPFINGQICAGNGTCDGATGTCLCNAGYSGPACTTIQCPTGNAWFGNVGSEHSNMAICSGVGDCNRDWGTCSNCGGRWGAFSGPACQYLACYRDSLGRSCSGNGTCMTLEGLALYTYNSYKNLAGYTYTSPWDANMVQGCMCYRAISVDNQYANITDWYALSMFGSTINGSNPLFPNRTRYVQQSINRDRFYRGPFAFASTDFKGYGCQRALCPKGDDPLTSGVNEVQLLHCRADSGSFKLIFRGNTTREIPYNSSAAFLKGRLQELNTIRRVAVTLSGNNNHTICSYRGNIGVYIEFLTEFGDLPLLVADTTNLYHNYPVTSGFKGSLLVNVTEYQQCTKEDKECSGRGICAEDVGQCSCSVGFGSSNGTVKFPGATGDCSFFNPFYTANYVSEDDDG